MLPLALAEVACGLEYVRTVGVGVVEDSFAVAISAREVVINGVRYSLLSPIIVGLSFDHLRSFIGKGVVPRP